MKAWQTYLVGGAVRDRLMGLPVNDHDYVLVGATPDQLLQAGYTSVGSDFPVFLHPITHDEYALARCERKVGPGYKGFVVEFDSTVTLEQDLARRDLTINAMAQYVLEDGTITPTIIDPFGGQEDLACKQLRHVSEAFVEDPVRVLRVARFAARWPDFSVSESTMRLMKEMVVRGEVAHLVPERVWQEMSRALMEIAPARFFEVLLDCGALAVIWPELSKLVGIPQNPAYHLDTDVWTHTMQCVTLAAQQGCPLDVRMALLCHELGKGSTDTVRWPHHAGHEWVGAHLTTECCRRLRMPHQIADLATLYTKVHGHLHRGEELSPAAMFEVLAQCDVFRRPERFERLLMAANLDFQARMGVGRAYPPYDRWQMALQAVQSVNVGEIARAIDVNQNKAEDVVRHLQPETIQFKEGMNKGHSIAAKIQEARIAAIAEIIKRNN